MGKSFRSATFYRELIKRGGDSMVKVFNIRSLAVMGLIVTAVAVMASAALAAGKSGTTKPGWGYGDKNHVHTGPPGSVHP